MEFTIIVSEKDIAGMTIRKSLLEYHDFVKTDKSYHNIPVYKIEIEDKKVFLYTIEEDSIYFEDILPGDYLIYATKHKSKSGKRTLSVHVPGNYGDAEFGGNERELSTAPTILLKTTFNILTEKGQDTEYSVTLEATHHGPSFQKPVMFIEIGSKELQWKDKNAGKIIADTIIKSIEEYKPIKGKVAIGFGGTHYCSNFNKVELRTDIAMSHICPKYNVQKIDKEMIIKMISSTYEKVDLALLDWKGLGSDEKNHLLPLLEELKIRWKKVKEIR